MVGFGPPLFLLEILMAITFYATNNFTGDGATVNWNINFADGYIDIANVKARYIDNTGGYVDIAISSVAGNVVTISPAVANGQEFQIYRDTEKRFPLVDFSDGAILNETNLDTLATQAVMVSAEAFDQSNNGVHIAGDSLVIAQGIDAKAQEALDNSEDALTTANGIAATAAQALTNSNTAVSTANAANSTANGIAATANQALTNSNAAITTANGAVTTANAATATANGIDAKATLAIDTANSAVATANAASIKADTAISTANSATATANAIDGKAQTALDNVTSLDALTMKKSANLSDIADKAAAWINVRPVGSTPLAGDPVNALDATTKRWVESSINSKMTEHIAGLNVNVTGTGITVSPGECYIPSEASILRLAVPKTVAHSGLTPATKYYIYAYKDNGTLGIEVSTTANVKYGYKASNKQSDSSRRFIGMFYFTGGSEVAVCKLIDGECVHLFPWGGIGRVLNLGTATTDVPVNYEKFVPLAAFTSVKLVVTNTTTTLASADITPAGFPYVTNVQPYYCKFLIDMPPSSGGGGIVAYKYPSAPLDGGGFFIDVAGYKYDR